MYMVLGNLTVAQFAERVGASFTDDELELLESHRSNNAQSIPADKFHIFDSPAISVYIGADALGAPLDAFKAANARQPFNREVGFYPASSTGSEQP